MTDPIDHDRHFKQLLTEFFGEFLELFLPQVTRYIEPGPFEFLDKEVFTDLPGGDRHEVDLVAKARFRDGEAFFLLHVETQAAARPEFARRMFNYFARLHERHALPVYPIALLSYDAPLRAEPDRYTIAFPNRAVLDFGFEVIQLNRLNWRDFVRQPNPVASALMAKMKIAPEDRPRVKLECLRLLATLKLNPAKMGLIGGFIDQYLKLNSAEEQVFQHDAAELSLPEMESVMSLKTQWEVLGEKRGTHRALAGTVMRLLRRRFGVVSDDLQHTIDSLSDDTLGDLSEALLDFGSMAEAQAWVARQPLGSQE